MNSYNLSRKWFDFCFINPEKIKPNHTALYFFAIEHCNRLGWKQKFGFPTTMVMEAIGIKSYNTYINTLNDLVEFGFIEMIERSKNQYSANIIALSNFNKALDKALDKAFIKHNTKQSESIDSIDKQETIKQGTIKEIVIYLNKILSTSYKPSTQKTKDSIIARLNEGFNVNDFKKVIDIKFAEWGKDEKMVKFLRPETLFSNKFESYLNQKGIKTETSGRKLEVKGKEYYANKNN